MIAIPVWLLALLVLLIVLLGVMLWSARAQRHARVRPGDVDRLEVSRRAIEGVTRGWLVEGNRVEILQNGDGFFPRLLADIAGARESIHYESYAWWKGDICSDSADAFAERARAGVDVRILLDAMGSFLMEEEILERLEEAGCRVAKYHPVRFRTLGRLNKRDHRKTAVFDGRTGYVFGHGMAQEWCGAGDGPKSWRDTGARIVGPAVAHLQSAFAQHWMEETGEVLAAAKYFPPLEAAGDVPVQVVPSSPRGGVSSVFLLYKTMIAAAREELLIQNPYFAPDHNLVDMLVTAAGRGVRVRLMVPGPVTDSPFVAHAGHQQFERLLAGGVEIYEHQRTLIHQKVMVIDGLWSHLGSTNFDERSFGINAEISAGFWSEEIAAELAAAFERDLEQCERIELENWRARPWRHKLLDRAAFLAHEQL